MKKSYLASRGPQVDVGIVSDLTPNKVCIYLPKLDLFTKIDLASESKFEGRHFDESKLSLNLSSDVVLKVCGKVKVKVELKKEELFKEPCCTLLLSADQIEEYERVVDAEKKG